MQFGFIHRKVSSEREYLLLNSHPSFDIADHKLEKRLSAIREPLCDFFKSP